MTRFDPRTRVLPASRRYRLAGASAAALLWAVAASGAQALPASPTIVGSSGEPGVAATFTPGGGTFTIDQNHSRVVIDWASFNIGAGETVTFNQPTTSAIAFNRINSLSFTTIDGALNANGSVWLFSPGGLLIGSGAVIAAGSFVASTGQLADGDLLDALTGDLVVVSPLGIRNGAPLTVADGATITTDAGFIGFLGENLTIETDLTASDAIWIGVAEGGTFEIDQTSEDVYLIDATVAGVDGRGQPQLTLSGDMYAGSWFGISTPGSGEPNWATVINMEGTITAQGVKPASGYASNDSVVFFVGSDGVAAYNYVSADFNAESASIYAALDMYVSGAANATLGNASIGDNLDVINAGSFSVVGSVNVSNQAFISAGSVNISGSLSANYVDIFSAFTSVYGSLTASGSGSFDYAIDIDSYFDIDVGYGGYIGATGGGSVRVSTTDTAGSIDIYGLISGYNVTVSGGNAVSVAGEIYATNYASVFGRSSVDVSGLVSGTYGANLSASYADNPVAGGVYVSGEVLSLDGDITLYSDNLAGVEITGGVRADGVISITATEGDVLIADAAEVIASGGLLTVTAADDLTVEELAIVGATEMTFQTTRATGTLTIAADLSASEVSVLGAADVVISGDIAATQILISSAYTTPVNAGIDIYGELYAPGGIAIINRNLGATVIHTGGGLMMPYEVVAGRIDPDSHTALLGLDGDIYIYSLGTFIQEAGSTINATGGFGVDAGLLTIVGGAADGVDGAAVQLNGEVIAVNTVVETLAGSIEIGGEIDSSATVQLTSAEDITTTATASITTSTLSGDISGYAEGDVYLGGDLTSVNIYFGSSGAASPGGSLIEVSGTLYAADSVTLINYDGDINLASTALIELGTPPTTGSSQVLISAYGTVSSEAGSTILATASGYGSVVIDSTLADGTGVDLAGDIYAETIEISTSDGADLYIRGGVIDSGDDVMVDSSGALSVTGGLIQAGTTVDFYSEADMLLAGEVEAATIRANVQPGSVPGSVLRVEGLLTATDLIGIVNHVGVVEIGSGAELRGNAGGALPDAYHSVAITGERIITEAGSYITAGVDGGALDGSVALTATGDTVDGPAIDLSGDISAESLVLDAGTGSLRIRDGRTYVLGGLYNALDGYFLVDAAAEIDAVQGMYVSADGIEMNGTITSEGSVSLVTSNSGADVVVGGDILVDGSIVLRSAASNVLLTDGATLHANRDSATIDGDTIDLIAWYGTVTTETNTSILLGVTGAPAGDVTIYAGGSDGPGYSAIDLSGDIEATYLRLTVLGGSIHLRDGDIDVTYTLDVDTPAAFIMDAPATITSGASVYVDAGTTLVADGQITAGADVFLTLGSSATSDLLVGGSITADEGISIRNDGSGNVEISGSLTSNADDYSISIEGVTILSFGQVITTAGSSITGAYGDSVSITAYGLDDLASAAIDLSGDITAGSLDLTAPNGSIWLREGTITVDDPLTIASGLDVTMEAAASIVAASDVSISADRNLSLGGDLTAGGDVDLFQGSASTADLLLAVNVTAGGSISVENQGIGDIVIDGELIADSDGVGGEGIDITSNQGVVTGASSLLQALDGSVSIFANGNDLGGYAAIELSGDITAASVSLNAANGSIQLADGTITVYGPLDIISNFDFLMEAPAAIVADGDVTIDAIWSLVIDGQIESGGDVDLSLSVFTLNDLEVGGSITADGAITAQSVGGGDVVISGSLIADADGVGGEGVDIDSNGHVITETGSLIQALDGAVNITAAGGAIDLSGDITAASLDLDATGGSIWLRDGTITVTDPLTITADLDFFMEGAAVIDAASDVSIYAGQTLSLGGDLDAGGDVNLTLGASSTNDLLVGVDLTAGGAVAITNNGSGDVVIDGAVIADSDGVGGEGVDIISNARVITGTSSLIQALDGAVNITADGVDGSPEAAIDLSGDITAASLDLTAPNGSIWLRDGTISVTDPLVITTGLDFTMDAAAVIDADSDVAISAERSLSLGGDLDAGGDVSLTLGASSTNDLFVGVDLTAGGAVAITNNGSGDVLIDGIVTADSDGVGGEGIDVVSNGQVITGSESALLAANGAVTITADGADGPDTSALDLWGDIIAQSLTLTADAGSIHLADGTITVEDPLVIVSSFDVVMDAPAIIDAASDVTMTADRALVVDGELTSGGDVALTITGGSSDLAVGGVVVAAGDVSIVNEGSGDVLIDGETRALAGDLTVVSQASIFTGADSILAAGPTGLGGLVSVLAYGDVADIGGDVSGGSVVIGSYGDVVLRDGGSIRGYGIRITAIDEVTTEANSSIEALAAPAITAAIAPEAAGWPILPQDVAEVVIAASDVNIAGTITAPTAIQFFATNEAGVVTVGGSGATGGFTLDNSEFQNLSAPNVIVASGYGINSEGAEMHLGDLTIDSDLVGSLWLGTSGLLVVNGAVESTGDEAVSVHLGFVQVVSTPDPLEPMLADFIPSAIHIIGSLGTVDNPLGQVTLIAQGDVLFGSQAFIDAAEADPEFNAYEESGDYSPEAGHIFVASDSLLIASLGRVLQQNTGGEGEYVGLVIGAPVEDGELIFAPDGLEGMQIGGPSGWTANFAAGPTQVELFGQILLPGGEVVTGPIAADTPHLLDPDIAMGEFYFNNCIFGGGEACGDTSPPENEYPDIPPFTDPTLPDVYDPVFVPAPSLFVFAFANEEPDEEEEEDEIQGEPVTGSGNEDLWPVGSPSAGVRP